MRCSERAHRFRATALMLLRIKEVLTLLRVPNPPSYLSKRISGTFGICLALGRHPTCWLTLEAQPPSRVRSLSRNDAVFRDKPG